MARAGTICNLFVGLLVLFSLIAGPSGSQTEAPSLTLFVHGFRDPCERTAPMNQTPPTHEQPQTGACQSADPRQPLTYVFGAERPLPAAVTLDASRQVLAEFWIRPHQPQNGVPLSPGPTTVTSSLRLPDGSDLGGGSATQTLGASTTPTRFRILFTPADRTLPEGAHLEWMVAISAPGSTYNYAAAPYGVSAQHPFYVAIPIQPPPEAPRRELSIEASRPVAALVVGETANVTVVVRNEGSQTTQAWVGLVGLDESAMEVHWPPQDGAPGQTPVSLAPGMQVYQTLRVTARQGGNSSFVIRAYGSHGEIDDQRIDVSVADDSDPPVLRPSAAPTCPRGGLAASVLAAGTTTAPMTAALECPWDPTERPAKVQVDVARTAGRVVVTILDSGGGRLFDETLERDASFQRPVDGAVGNWTLRVLLEEFVGSYTITSAAPATPGPDPSDSPRRDAPSSSVIQAFLLGAGSVVALVLGALFWNLNRR